MSEKKCFMFHNWGRYGKLYDCFDGFTKQQARQCKSCGKIEVRAVRLGGQTDAKFLNKSAGIED